MADIEGTNPLAGLFQKLVTVLKQIERVPKNGHNKFYNYDYVMEADLVDHIRPMLADVGVFLFTSIEAVSPAEIKESQSGGKQRIVNVTTHHTFVDADTGAEYMVKGAGAGEDAGDKALFKAITGAEKYALMKNFLVATGDDPEQDGKHDGAAPAKAASPAKPKSTYTLKPAPPVNAPPTEEEMAEGLGLDGGHEQGEPAPEDGETAPWEGEDSPDPTPQPPPKPQTKPKPVAQTKKSPSSSPAPGIGIKRRVYVNKEWEPTTGTNKNGDWTKYSFGFADAETKEKFSSGTFSSTTAEKIRALVGSRSPQEIYFTKNGNFWNLVDED